MKKIMRLFLIMIILMPVVSVKALSCRGEKPENAIDLKAISNFSCSDVKSDKLTFTNNGKDLSSYFELRDDKSTIDIIDASLVFDKELEYAIVNISDGESSVNIFVKNYQYEKPTTTTTTTKDASVKTLIVTLDPNNGEEVSEKSCEINSVNTTCNITLPQLDDENFNGWGTANTCKEGNNGTIRVEKDIKYYACYKSNENNSDTVVTADKIYLKSLNLSDKVTNEEIVFGTFSIKNTEYNFKVLNSTESIGVNAVADEGVTVEVIGNEHLKVGENKILIKLSSNDMKNEYVLNVTRLEEGETLNTVNYLKSLVIGGYEINFDKERLVYSLTIPSEVNKLQITAIAEDENYTPEVLNNENLVDGSQVLINITDESNNTTSYVINIIKEANVNYLLLGAIGLIVILIIILIILILIKSKKNKTNKISNKKSNEIEVLKI